MSRLVHVLKTGIMPYIDSLKLQKSISNRLIKGDINFKNVLILTEHPAVYTIGIRTKNYTMEDEQKLLKLGAEFHRTNRGGLITFHGPGQLVAYPIINLKNFQPSVRWYVSQMEKTVINLCSKYDIIAKTTADTGVWVNDRKICAIGIHASRYITTHGLALNCNIALNWFKHIVPCGLEGKEVTSLTKELSKDTTINAVIPNFLTSFNETFECETKLIEPTESKDFINSIIL